MTTSVAREVSSRRRRRIPPKGQRLTMGGDALDVFRTALGQARGIRWPSARYRDDPVRFFREILGVDPWSKQVEIIEKVRDHPRVAVRSGHKVSKSHSAAGLGLWFYSSFDDARVVMSSTTSRQVDQILWRELRMMLSRSGRCLACKLRDPDGREIPRPCPHSALVPEEPGQLARTGLKSADFREIVGFTAREAEAVAGVSGKNLLYIIDEASGVDEAIFEAIEGNRAGGARIVLFGNPTRNEGEHYEAFHGKSDFYATVTVSSEETPNVVERREVVRGLATYEWVEEKRREWGEDSPMYIVRVKGLHALLEDGRIWSIHRIQQAEQLWEETAAEGRLFIGLDPAGESGTGDEAVWAPRRGRKLLELDVPQTGLTPEGHVLHTLGVIGRHAVPRETPVVVLDREGAVGARVYGEFRAFLEQHQQAPPFELVALRASDGASRQPHIFDRLRDELAGNLESWFRDGGAIVEDSKLAKELHAFEWQQQTNGRLKLWPPKKILRRSASPGIGRSPDRFDALALSCWEPLALRDDLPPSAKAAVEHERDFVEHNLDPYAGADVWGRNR